MSNWKKTKNEIPLINKDLIFKDYVGDNSFGFHDKINDKFWDYNGSRSLPSFCVESWYYIPEYDIK